MSNVIKPHAYVSLNESLKIDSFVIRSPMAANAPGSEANGETANDNAASKNDSAHTEAAEKLLSDAKLAAQEQLRHAEEETALMREAAAAEIDAWWDQRRMEDLHVVEESRRNGYEAGYREGLEQARKETAAQYEALLREAAQLIEDAHRVKEAVIAEAEPFLVELSLGIARKIIGNHVDTSPNWTIDHVRKTLERRKEKGIITLCVAPSQFAKIQDARAELLLATDSQAELQIVPDYTVDEGGCVVRTSFGSIDARIDTQLSEVKAAMLEIALADDRSRLGGGDLQGGWGERP